MDLDLTGRSVLITGASRGIGLATARRFVAEGCQVILVARDGEALAAAAQALGGARTVAADLSIEAERERAVAAAGPVDVLVNNAGAIPGGSLLELDDARWQEAWQLKVFGTIAMSRHVYGPMKARGGGVIVNVIGNAGEALDYDYICGSTGNAALMAFTRALGSKSYRDGVRVEGVNPGPVDTGRLETVLMKKAEARTGSSEGWERLREPMPFSRPAHPREIAAMIAMLASPLSAYTSGTVVTIDGGLASQGATF